MKLGQQSLRAHFHMSDVKPLLTARFFFHGPCFRWVAVKKSLRQQNSKYLDGLAKNRSCSDIRPMGQKPKAICKVLSFGDCGPNRTPFGKIPCGASPFPTCFSAVYGP